ncbi:MULTISPECIES: phosphoadenosine phosphosulfate reductase family protein [Bacillota]|uniref:phosphoadenosine phosphosulfate reductase domain-containing protein n=1 Tax=Bacillota TaxID=1239 RepID=UPI0039EE2565
MKLKITPPREINELISKGAIFYISHSGGKDSQAMYILLKDLIPEEQIVVVHADLGEVEWLGVQDHILNTIKHDLNVVKAVKRNGEPKTLLGMVEERQKWPSSSCRQCTSDLKRGPIMKFIRNDLKKKGATLAINCTGIRAEESDARAKKNPFALNKRESVNKRVQRTVFDWMPIFDLSKKEVFRLIEEAKQRPFWAYKKNERLSCVFCIMGSINDLRHGAEQRPELYKKYVNLEKQIGHTMFMKANEPIYLEDHIGIKVTA